MMRKSRKNPGEVPDPSGEEVTLNEISAWFSDAKILHPGKRIAQKFTREVEDRRSLYFSAKSKESQDLSAMFDDLAAIIRSLEEKISEIRQHSISGRAMITTPVMQELYDAARFLNTYLPRGGAGRKPAGFVKDASYFDLWLQAFVPHRPTEAARRCVIHHVLKRLGYKTRTRDEVARLVKRRRQTHLW